MTEHEICKGCRWNKYPVCEGMKMFDGNYMTIENLRKEFQCGQKDSSMMVDFSIKQKTADQLKIEELEARLAILEQK